MRAKFKVDVVDRFENEDYPPCERIIFSAVCADKFGENGESEDNDFARWTPQGDLTITVNNPNLLGTIKVGEKYYLDFTKAE